MFVDDKFSKEDPVVIFDFLTRFVRAAEILGIAEGNSFPALKLFLNMRAYRIIND